MLMINLENLSNVIDSFFGPDNFTVLLDPIIFFLVEFSLLYRLEILVQLFPVFWAGKNQVDVGVT